MLEKSRFLELMTGLSQLYDKDLSPFALDIYYDILKDYEYPRLEKAVKQVIANNKYNCIPKPAEILEYLVGTRDDKALSAWLQAHNAAIAVGHWQSVEFKDPIISHCLNELGGWIAFCSAQIEELPFIEKRFMNLYNLFLKREVKEPMKLVGFVELKNFEKGYFTDIPEPIKIGFTEEQKQLEHPLKIF